MNVYFKKLKKYIEKSQKLLYIDINKYDSIEIDMLLGEELETALNDFSKKFHSINLNLELSLKQHHDVNYNNFSEKLYKSLCDVMGEQRVIIDYWEQLTIEGKSKDGIPKFYYTFCPFLTFTKKSPSSDISRVYVGNFGGPLKNPIFYIFKELDKLFKSEQKRLENETEDFHVIKLYKSNEGTLRSNSLRAYLDNWHINKPITKRKYCIERIEKQYNKILHIIKEQKDWFKKRNEKYELLKSDFQDDIDYINSISKEYNDNLIQWRRRYKKLNVDWNKLPLNTFNDVSEVGKFLKTINT